MRLPVSKYWAFVITVCIIFACRKQYAPAVITVGNNFLVVDGVINTAPNGVTTINLSRARNLGDTATQDIPETNATITIEASGGADYLLHPATGMAYVSDTLTLDPSQKYRLRVATSNGEQYLSQYVQAKQSPPIDSITWQQDSGVVIYTYTHDATNNTRYYRWDYTETWEHNAPYEISWGDSANTIISVTSTTYATYTYHCWSDANSTDITLGTSAALSQDVINKMPVAYVPNNSEKIRIRYSILVRQYALTEEAYQYWGIIQKNTQKIGTLFDAEPSKLHGNITCLNNGNEPVIGFVSAGSVEQKRIFIDHLDLVNWQPPPLQTYCPVKLIPHDPNNFLYYDYPDTAWAPYYFASSSALNITKKECLDCRRQGGTNLKPGFWQ